MSVFAIALLLTCVPSAILDLALPKWKADPHVRIEDAYKWTYQATRGGEHAAPDEASAHKWLDGEWGLLSVPLADEPIWEPLCKGGEIGRLNLRPFRAKGGKEDDLLTAFLASSREYRTDARTFTDAWDALGQRLRKGSVGKLNHKAWEKLDAEMRPQGYPAIHHSKEYEGAHHPSYRVLTRSQVDLIMPR
jgi:hypothetical protein